MTLRLWLAAGAVAALAVGAVTLTGDDDYEVKMVMPSAAQLSKRTPVWINGQHAGSITDLEVKDGKAVATLSIDSDFGPLHTGTGSRVEWLSAVGERVLTVYPGAEANPEIPEGSFFEGPSHQIEVDELLATFDEPTRHRISSLLAGLNGTVDGREDELRATIHAASGSVQALGAVLQAVGSDGPAIRALVTQLSRMTEVAGGRRDEIANVVADLDAVTGSIVDEQAAISDTLEQLPGTLQTAQGTLGRVPATSEATVELLKDLRPATSKLPSVSADLAPTLVDLRPAVRELRPLLVAADELLGYTPGLLDSSHVVVPGTTDLFDALGPAIAFLRPYTPEAVGGLFNWGQAFAQYDGAGHTWTGLLAPGVNANNESLVPLPTTRLNPTPAPGLPEGQPWTDATGSEIR